MQNPPAKNQQAMIAFMKRVTLPRILKDMEQKDNLTQGTQKSA
jgi:hypothetical protein